MSARPPRTARKIARVIGEVGPHPRLLVAELVHRARARAAAQRLRHTYPHVVAVPPPGATLRLPPVDLPHVSALPPALAEAAAVLEVEAEDGVAHRFDVLGSGPIEHGERIEWHADPLTRHLWPSGFYQDIVVRQLGSDPKLPWELSRGHHLLALARAAALFRDERFANAFERDLTSWLDANPVGIGINWTCAMEVAIRAINWVFSLAALQPFRPLPPLLRERVVRSLQSHGRHVEGNLEGSPLLRGNHYLADVTGLFVLGNVLDGDPAAARWRALGRRALEREACAQIGDDGVGFEASLPYHGLALELFLVAQATAQRAGEPFSCRFEDRLRAMLAVSAGVRHPQGRMPQIGDSDSGRILPAGSRREATHDNLLWLGAALLGERQLDGDPDPEVAWTLGLDAWHRAASVPVAERTLRAFPVSGVYVLAGGGAHCVVRCGRVGQNGRGGHAHNDLLSFELSLGGEPIVVDPGTFAYTSDPTLRDLFRSTGMHSTVRLDGEEQRPLPPGDVFRLPETAAPSVHAASLAGPVARVVGSHRGYQRLDPGAVHRRTFELDRTTGVLTIEDELLGTGTRLVESFVHLAPEVRVKRVGGALALERGDARLVLQISGLDELEVVDGLHSEQFGVAETTQVVVARAVRRLPCSFSLSLSPLGARLAALDPGTVEVAG
jgi:hypothetical protein